MKNWGGAKRLFLERKFRLRRLRTAASRKRGAILGKTKTTEPAPITEMLPNQISRNVDAMVDI